LVVIKELVCVKVGLLTVHEMFVYTAVHTYIYYTGKYH
jgi:hypothetical protein